MAGRSNCRMLVYQLSHPNVKKVKGDVLDPKAVEAAVTEANAAISALGVKLGQAPGTVRSVGTDNIVKARRAGSVVVNGARGSVVELVCGFVPNAEA